MGLDIYFNNDYYILCICEDSAEEDIMNWLLEENKLKFSKDDLIDKKFIRIRGARKIQDKYLSFDHQKEVVILRILDSSKENFNLDNLFKDRFEVVNAITNPEIEILIIINFDDLKVYSQKHKNTKPSSYAKSQYSIKNIKKYGTMRKIFNNDIDSLIKSIDIHKAKISKTQYTINDLLKE